MFNYCAVFTAGLHVMRRFCGTGCVLNTREAGCRQAGFASLLGLLFVLLVLWQLRVLGGGMLCCNEHSSLQYLLCTQYLLTAVLTQHGM